MERIRASSRFNSEPLCLNTDEKVRQAAYSTCKQYLPSVAPTQVMNTSSCNCWVQVERQAVEEAAEERHKAEVRHAHTQLLHMEDWSGASRDRFLGVKPNTAFEQRLKQVSGTQKVQL